jgi:hypothetical protein
MNKTINTIYIIIIILFKPINLIRYKSIKYKKEDAIY